MGIPSFYRILIQTYDGLILNTDNFKISHLFLDFNCGLHPCVHEVLNNLNEKDIEYKTIEELEKLFIKKIISYLNYLFNTISPTKMLYIAIDGPAPKAKQNQQRERRFKSIKEKKIN